MGHSQPTQSDQARKPKLLDQLRAAIRVRHYSIRTERSYCDWVKRSCGYRHSTLRQYRHVLRALRAYGIRRPAELTPERAHSFVSRIAATGASWSWIGLNIAVLFVGALTIVSCAKHEATLPVHIDTADVPLLREISLAAIAERIPSMSHDRLKYEHTTYHLYRDHFVEGTNEMFSVEFRVVDSMREVERDGENVFEVDSISAEIQPDGRIDDGGVGSNTTRYLTADLNPLQARGSTTSPVWGDPFYPVTLESPSDRRPQ